MSADSCEHTVAIALEGLDVSEWIRKACDEAVVFVSMLICV